MKLQIVIGLISGLVLVSSEAVKKPEDDVQNDKQSIAPKKHAKRGLLGIGYGYGGHFDNFAEHGILTGNEGHVHGLDYSSIGGYGHGSSGLEGGYDHELISLGNGHGSAGLQHGHGIGQALGDSFGHGLQSSGGLLEHGIGHGLESFGNDHSGLEFSGNGFESGLDGGHGFTHEHSSLTLNHEHVKTVAVPVPHLVPYPVEKKVPYLVKVPVHIPVDRPYPVHVPKPYPVTVEKPVPYPVIKRVPYPVKVPVKVAVPHPVPVPYPKLVPYPVHKPVPYPVKVPVVVEKHVPVFVKGHHEEDGGFDGHHFGYH